MRIVLAAYILWSAAYVWLSSCVDADGRRWFLLLDDMMISMTYARTFAQGGGLVWFPGADRVEGISNLLWTLLMAIPHAAGVPARFAALPMQLLGLFFSATTIALLGSRELAAGPSEAGGRAGAASALPPRWLAGLMMAAYVPLARWNLLGAEVSALGLLIVAAMVLGLRVVRGAATGAVVAMIHVALALALLIRPDALIPALVLWTALWMLDRGRRAAHLAGAAAAVLIGIAAPTCFRLLYYGDLLPNTYTLKMAGVPTFTRVGRGAIVFGEFLLRGFWVPVVLALIALAGGRWRSPARLLPASLFAAQCAYSVWVGGDAWENFGGANRFVAIALPGLFLLTAEGIWRVVQWGGAPASPGMAAALRIGALVLVLNLSAGLRTLAEWTFVRPPVFVLENRKYLAIGLALRDATPPTARIAVNAAGIIPYVAERPAIDLLGKSDRRIAALPAQIGPGWAGVRDFEPGHVKWDYAWSLGTLKPDVVVGIYRGDPAGIAALGSAYRKISIEGADVFFRLPAAPGSPVAPGN